MQGTKAACSLVENRHFDSEEMANRVSQLMMEEKHKVLSEEDPTKRKGFAGYLEDNHNIYDFDKSKPALKRSGLAKLAQRNLACKSLLKRMESDRKSTKADRDKVKENMSFIEDLYKKEDIKDKKRREAAADDRRDKLRSSSYQSSGDRVSGCGSGGSSACGC